MSPEKKKKPTSKYSTGIYIKLWYKVTGKMIFKTSGATVTLMELNQYFSMWSNFVGIIKAF